jgi:hypothetical protein
MLQMVELQPTRIYTHSNVQQIREAIERRNQLLAMPVEAVQKAATVA